VDTRRLLAYFWKLLGLLVPAAAIVLADQYTKDLVRNSMPLGQVDTLPWPWLSPWITLHHIANTGVAFGSLQGLNTFFTVLVAVVALVITYYYLRLEPVHWPVRLGATLLLGGNVGNLIDRIYQGYVTDFLAIRWFAVINLADACITTGVILALLGYWLTEKQQAPPGL